MNVTCSKAQRVLHAYFDGELPESMRGLMDGHLAGCASCRSALAEMRKLAVTLTALPAEPLPEQAVARFMVRASTEGNAIPIRKSATLRPAFGALLAAASLLLGLFLGGRLGRPSPTTVNPPEVLLAAASTMDLLPAGSPAADLLTAMPPERR